MNADDAIPEKNDTKPSGTKLNLVVMLSLAILVGVLLAGAAFGTYFYVQKANDFEAKVKTMASSLEAKDQTIAGLLDQIKALSRQMYLLRDYAIARSSAVKPAEDVNVVQDAEVHDPIPTAKPAATAAAGAVAHPDHDAPANALASHPKDKTPKAQPVHKSRAQNCDLVGKSPAEQVEILRRCVSLIDPPENKPVSR